jgi:hypothetical protein
MHLLRYGLVDVQLTEPGFAVLRHANKGGAATAAAVGVTNLDEFTQMRLVRSQRT